jgi:hypothetical protein
MPDQRPLLFVDVDGVISLFGFSAANPEVEGRFHWIDGVGHFIPNQAGRRLERLAEAYDLVWATGWEEKANQYLPFILKLPFHDLPCLSFHGRALFGSADWKLDGIAAHATNRPMAWIDDNLSDAVKEWAFARPAPTLLVETRPSTGMTDRHVEAMLAWAAKLAKADRDREPGQDSAGEAIA